MQKRILLYVALVAGLDLGASGVLAASQQEDTAPELTYVGGVGGITCEKFMDFKAKSTVAQLDPFVEWVQGFRTAYDMRNNFGKHLKRTSDGNVSEIADSTTVVRHLVTYCTEHPLDTVMDGTIAFINEAGGQISWKENVK
jgi:hypothetical protein